MYVYCTDPVEVIGLYKDLIPSEFDSLLSGLYLREPPLLEGEALIRATKCLIDYLNQVICSVVCCNVLIEKSTC